MADTEQPNEDEETEQKNDKEQQNENPLENATESKLKLPLKYYIKSDDLLNILYLQHMIHPNATLRLFIFAEYGPLFNQHSYHQCLCGECRQICKQKRKENTSAKELYFGTVLIGSKQLKIDDESLNWLCAKCRIHCSSIYHIKSGQNHIVSDSELLKMESEIQRSDILSSFVSKQERLCNPLSIAEENEVIHGQKKKNVPILTRDQVLALLQKLETFKLDDSGDEVYSFYDLSAMIKKFRTDLKKNLFKTRDTLKNRSKGLESNALRYTSKHRVPQCQESNVLTCLLHEYTHNISTLANASKTDITQNVRLLRYLKKDNQTDWDGNCCFNK